MVLLVFLGLSMRKHTHPFCMFMMVPYSYIHIYIFSTVTLHSSNIDFNFSFLTFYFSSMIWFVCECLVVCGFFYYFSIEKNKYKWNLRGLEDGMRWNRNIFLVALGMFHVITYLYLFGIFYFIFRMHIAFKL